ncbi:hypothetical protein HO675_08750 [Streptococcus suis]|nr:hypothetical protein [Streptococcus suis]
MYSDEALVNGVLIGFWLTSIAISVVWYLLTIFSNMVLFRRAGYAAWKALIPIYNLYIQQCITFGEEKGIFILFILIPVAGPIYSLYLTYNYGRAFGLSTVQSVFYLFFTPLFNVYMAIKEAHSYKGPQEFFLN